MRMHQKIDGTDRYIDVPDVASVIAVHEESGWAQAPVEEPGPVPAAPAEPEVDLDALRDELRSLGRRNIPQRWDEARLRREIDAARSAEPGEAVDETEDE